MSNITVKKPRQFVDSATLDVHGLFFSWQESERYNKPVELFSESQQHNFRQQCYVWLNFSVILWSNSWVHCNVLFYEKCALLMPTKYRIRGLGVHQNGAYVHLLSKLVWSSTFY